MCPSKYINGYKYYSFTYEAILCSNLKEQNSYSKYKNFSTRNQLKNQVAGKKVKFLFYHSFTNK